MRFPATAGWVCATLALTSAARGSDSSLPDLDVEFAEAKVTLQVVTDENTSLHQQLDAAKEQLRSVTESLAISNSEAEVFKREAGELKLRMEALGMDAAGSNRGKVEQRLLKAVSDLKILQDEKNKLADQLVRLSEAVVRFLQGAVSTDGNARMALEVEMRAMSEALGVPSSRAVEATAIPATLTDGMVISVKEEYALVIANLGSRHGVKIGMPFQVWRGIEKIGEVRVVDVREKISGAVIQDLNPKEKIKVGDCLRVDAR